jgi:hypothetical protein
MASRLGQPRPEGCHGACQPAVRVWAGIPGKPPRLTLGDIYPVLRPRLRAKSLPVPNQRGTDTAYQFPFTANAAARSGPDARSTQPEGNGTGGAAHKNREPARADRARVTRIAARFRHDYRVSQPGQKSNRKRSTGIGRPKAIYRNWPVDPG